MPQTAIPLHQQPKRNRLLPEPSHGARASTNYRLIAERLWTRIPGADPRAAGCRDLVAAAPRTPNHTVAEHRDGAVLHRRFQPIQTSSRGTSNDGALEVKRCRVGRVNEQLFGRTPPHDEL